MHEYSLKNKIKIFPYLAHQEVIKEYLKSSVLLLLLFNSESGKGNIPGKLFEYLASKKPIIAFGAGDGDVKEIIRKTNDSFFLNYKSSKQTIKEALNFYLSANSAFEEKEYTKDYSRKNLTALLAEKLNGLI